MNRCLTATGATAGRGARLVGEIGTPAEAARRAPQRDGIDPDDVIMSPDRARRARPDLDGDVPARQPGPGRLGHQEHGHRSERGRCRRRLSQDRPGPRLHHGNAAPSPPSRARAPSRVKPGDVIVLICRGPMGAGMEEIYQITAALKHLSFGKHIAVLTDARFSGVSTGACIGHVGPEALAGGPIGKVRDGDTIRIVVDRNKLEGSVDLVGEQRRPGSSLQRRGRRSGPGQPAAAPRSGRRPEAAGRHETMGRPAAGQRRHLGRLRLRRRRHHQGPAIFEGVSRVRCKKSPGCTLLAVLEFLPDFRLRRKRGLTCNQIRVEPPLHAAQLLEENRQIGLHQSHLDLIKIRKCETAYIPLPGS